MEYDFAALRAILADVTQVTDPLALEPDDDLAQRGLTSLETVAVIVEIENRSGCVIPDESITPDMFASLRNLANAVASAAPSA